MPIALDPTRWRSCPCRGRPADRYAYIRARSAGRRVLDLSDVVADFRPDLIVAGELIEHTQNTLGWLSSLAGQVPGVGPLRDATIRPY